MNEQYWTALEKGIDAARRAAVEMGYESLDELMLEVGLEEDEADGTWFPVGEEIPPSTFAGKMEEVQVFSLIEGHGFLENKEVIIQGTVAFIDIDDLA